MQDNSCSMCKKNIAVIFITKSENNVSTNEGICIKCARALNIKPIEDIINRMDLPDEDIESLTEEMTEILNNNPTALTDGSMDRLLDQKYKDRKTKSDQNKNTPCSRCNKRLAVIFITKIENGVSTNSGLCLWCARELKIKPVEDIIKRMGLSDNDLDDLTAEMTEMMNVKNDNNFEGKADYIKQRFGSVDANKKTKGATSQNAADSSKREIVKNLIGRTEVQKDQFESIGLEVSSFGYNVDNHYRIESFIEVKSIDLNKLKGSYKVGMNLYDENEHILFSKNRSLLKSSFSGYQMYDLSFTENNLAINTHKIKIFIHKFLGG